VMVGSSWVMGQVECLAHLNGLSTQRSDDAWSNMVYAGYNSVCVLSAAPLLFAQCLISPDVDGWRERGQQGVGRFFK
jgi:hypothetical protein